MLKITVSIAEQYDEIKEEFIPPKTQVLQLEHSLVSLSKWESKWHKSFLANEDKTLEESNDYIRCMTITQNVDPDVYKFISNEDIDRITKYINASMTATTFSKEQKSGNREVITSEIIYYWMIAFNIPFECQKWHLDRLLTLINVCNVKNKPQKKMSRRETMSRQSALNAARRKSLHTKG